MKKVLVVAFGLLFLTGCGSTWIDAMWEALLGHIGNDDPVEVDPTPTPVPSGTSFHLPEEVGSTSNQDIPPGVMICTANYSPFGYNPPDNYYGSTAVGQVIYTNVETGERFQIPVDSMQVGSPTDIREDADNWCKKKWDWNTHGGYWYTSREENANCDRTRRGYAIAPWYVPGKFSVSIQHRVTGNRTKDAWLCFTIWKNGGEYREHYWWVWNQQGDAGTVEIPMPNTEGGVEFYQPETDPTPTAAP